MLSYEEWFEFYEPNANELNEGLDAPFMGTMFETYGRELEYVLRMDERLVWTLTESNSGRLSIVNGFATVNRFGYFVAAYPYEGEDIIIAVEDVPSE